ncbi:MAG: ABC transporter permease [Gammaproteobacteria bacterium]|nr:ABC transporter permease [Gammaproteobacteria bacterium]
MLNRLYAVFVARNLEFYRDRAALAWNLLLPVLIIAGFAFIFGGQSNDLYKVGVLGGKDAHPLALFDVKYIEFIDYDDPDLAKTKIQRHQLDLLVDPVTQRYWINELSPTGYMAERLLLGQQSGEFERATVTGRPIRYVDWLIPGVLAMNMMFSALFGIGFVIVRYRKNGVLKRLKATPLQAVEFLTAQIISRLWVLTLVTCFVYIGTHFFLNFHMNGSYLTLLLIFILGCVSLVCLGLVVAARSSNEELANGLLNLLTWPMMLLSGVWFSLEGSSAIVQNLAYLLPLTHVTEAAREVMIDGASFFQVMDHILSLAGMSLLFLIIGTLLFKWE